MRWVLISDDHPPQRGGVSTWLAAVARGLIAAGDSVRVVARQRPGLAEVPWPVQGVRGPSFGRWGPWWTRLALRLQPDERVLAVSWRPASRLRGPFDVVFHGSDLTCADPARLRALPAARHFAVSQFLADYAGRLGVPCEVLPAPIDPGLPVALGARHQRWLYIARATPLKGGDRFVRLVAAAGVEGTLVGDGPALVAWKRVAQRCGARLRFVGSRSAADVQRALDDADLVALLPRSGPAGCGTEGLGLSLLEAHARGVPVVGCRSGGVPEAVGPGLLLDDPDDLAASVSAIHSWWPGGGDGRDWLAAQHGVARLIMRLRS